MEKKVVMTKVGGVCHFLLLDPASDALLCCTSAAPLKASASGVKKGLPKHYCSHFVFTLFNQESALSLVVW